MEVFTSRTSRPSWAGRWDKGRTIWVVGLVPLISDKPPISTFNKVVDQNNKLMTWPCSWYNLRLMGLMTSTPWRSGLENLGDQMIRSRLAPVLVIRLLLRPLSLMEYGLKNLYVSNVPG